MQKKSAVLPEDWHRADIVAALKKEGWTVASLARKEGLASSTLYSALSHSHYPRGERIIANALGIPVEKIWAKRYAERNAKPALT